MPGNKGPKIWLQVILKKVKPWFFIGIVGAILLIAGFSLLYSGYWLYSLIPFALGILDLAYLYHETHST